MLLLHHLGAASQQYFDLTRGRNRCRVIVAVAVAPRLAAYPSHSACSEALHRHTAIILHTAGRSPRGAYPRPAARGQLERAGRLACWSPRLVRTERASTRVLGRKARAYNAPPKPMTASKLRRVSPVLDSAAMVVTLRSLDWQRPRNRGERNESRRGRCLRFGNTGAPTSSHPPKFRGKIGKRGVGGLGRAGTAPLTERLCGTALNPFLPMLH